ncbi:hypothetical protein TNCV_1391201 [Trichonephila clavipes]|nr:hypothetical protein TNCV_1391201 [Trichonephila clavipes]
MVQNDDQFVVKIPRVAYQCDVNIHSLTQRPSAGYLCLVNHTQYELGEGMPALVSSVWSSKLQGPSPKDFVKKAL